MGKKLALAVWVLGILGVALAGFRPDPYLTAVRALPLPHPYPTNTVLWVSLFISAQVVALLIALRPHSFRASWGRALVAVVISVGFLGIGVLGAMLSPPPWSVYLLWLFAMLAGMLLILGWSVVAAYRSRAGT